MGMKSKQVNINTILCRIDDTLIEKITSIDNQKKYQEMKKISRKKGKNNLVKQANNLVVNNI